MRHPILPLFPEKFFADTAHLSAEGAAFYLLLLAHAWTRGGSLPNDETALRNMTRLSGQKWRSIRREVMSFWTLGEDNRWHQKRLDLEWSRAGSRRPEGTSASQKVDELKHKSHTRHSAQKHNENNAAQLSSARARDPTPTPTEKISLPHSRERSSLAERPQQEAATLSVRAHASPPLRLVDDTPLAPAPVEEAANTTSPNPTSETNDAEPALTDERRDAIIAECQARIQTAAAAANLDNLREPNPGTDANRDRHNALAKLAQWDPNLRLALSHAARKAAHAPDPPPPKLAAE